MKTVDEKIDGVAADQHKRLEAIDAELEDVKRHLGRIWHFIGETDNVEMADAADQIRELRNRQERLEDEASAARAILTQRRSVLDDVNTIEAYAKDMRDFLKQSELTERKAFIQSFVKEIIVMPGDALLRYTVPMPDDSLIPGGVAEKVALNGSVLSTVQNGGPAAVGTAELPDLHYFCGRGAKDVIPLWRDAEATLPNLTAGLLDTLRAAHGTAVSARSLFAYAYGILAQPAYAEMFWDQLEMPPPRLPITKDAELFQRLAEHGGRLMYLHTYGERFGGPDDGSVPQEAALCTKAVSLEQYPADFSYDPTMRVLRVGDGEFSPVSPDVWDYSVSGLQVVKSWLDRRKLNRSGRKSSPLDAIRPDRWEFTEELLELLWVLEATLALQPEGAALLQEVCSSQLFIQDELPTPSSEERRSPHTAAAGKQQLGLLPEEAE